MLFGVTNTSMGRGIHLQALECTSIFSLLYKFVFFSSIYFLHTHTPCKYLCSLKLMKDEHTQSKKKKKKELVPVDFRYLLSSSIGLLGRKPALV